VQWLVEEALIMKLEQHDAALAKRAADSAAIAKAQAQVKRELEQVERAARGA
jgi:hypothetical protein